MIVINGPVYRKLLCGGYMHWREERLLIPPLHESPILRRYLSFISYHIWVIASEKSLLAVVNEKISLLQILLQANWHNFTLCQLLKLCWEHEEMKAWRNNILMKFLYHPNLAPSKYRLGALCDAFIKTDVLGPEQILALVRCHKNNMAKVATDFMKRYKWTSETPLSELAKYTEEINKSLRDNRKLRDHGADHLKKEATKIPHITTESNKIQARRLVLDEDEGIDWPDHFLLEPVQERLEKCDFSLSPSKEDLVNVIIMLSMRPADVATLRIDKYEASDEIWYDPEFSWYCTGYSKTKEETRVGEPQPFLSMEKDPIRAKEFLTWIQKAIPEKFPFLQKNKSGIVNVNPINLILAKHGITSKKLRKIGADHASRIHKGKNDSHR
ncbi:hypothetical protein RclHR1_05140016 [Rhizophagus clarus]|uniref:Uncharacterized protein n=1 Tax=Rhizophagus clarus TaxID=94130 RepID=A0A2Z6S488_9GLOM|nr:hypothetical protein RclHR1_05140016 [Rhizophagus clarus]